MERPEGALPQSAAQLDNDEPPFDNEIVIDVERLNIDAASFHQLMDVCDGDHDALSDRVLEIVSRSGKMENPVTGSGGMLTGVVRAIGPSYGPQRADETTDLAVGDRVATLVSLTLTPLSLDSIHSVHPDADQLSVHGRAYLPPSAPIVVMPDDIDPNVALKAYDVCGAPAQVDRLVQRFDDPAILILGVGTSGMLASAAARRRMHRDNIDGHIVAIDRDTAVADRLRHDGLIDDVGTADATSPVDVLETTTELLETSDDSPPRVDLALNTCNVGNTEMATILPVRQGGTAFFFNMATDFSAATLGAEGVGQDINLMMGNGYTRGHAELTTEILRDSPVIRELLSDLVD